MSGIKSVLPAKESSGLTRRDFVRSTAGALVAYVIGGMGLHSKEAKAAAPVWQRIPNQHWAIGESVFLDLTEFVEDADGDPLTLSLEDIPLPPGLSFDGRVISGTPTAEFPTTVYEVTADDGTIAEPRPKAPSGLSAD